MRQLVNTVSAFQFYHIMRYGAMVLTAVVFTKTSLTRVEIGSYETFLLLAGAVSFFWLNGLIKAMLPLAGRSSRPEDESQAIFSSFVVISLLGVLTALLLFLSRNFFPPLLLRGASAPFPALLTTYLVLGIPANLAEYIYLIRKNNRGLIVYAVVSSLLQVTFTALPAVLGWGIEAAVKGLVASYILRYLWLWVLLAGNYRLRVSIPFLRRYIRTALPLTGAIFLSGSAEFVDGFIVTTHFDEATLAIFRYGAREFPVTVLMANALSASLLPAMGDSSKLADNLHSILTNTRRLMHVLFPLSAVLLVLAHPLFPVLFNAGFSESATIFNIYLLLVASRLMFPQTVLIGMNLTRPLLTASFMELTLNIVLSLILVRFFGIGGIAAATVIAYAFEKIYLTAMVRKHLGIQSAAYIPWRLLLAYSAGLCGLFILIELMIY